jgi:hypothetical protein
MTGSYSVIVAAIVSAIIQAICTFALERLAKFDWLQASAIALVPSLIVLGAILFWLYGRRKQQALVAKTNIEETSIRQTDKRKVHFSNKDHRQGIAITREGVASEELLEVLDQIGLVEITGKLSESAFTPDACINSASRSLAFLGVLGSKWVNDPPVRARFSSFLTSVEANNGHVRFCLINPWGPAYKKLHGFRGGQISWESLRHYRDLMQRFKCLEVRLYDALPSFRLIFLDERVCVVARYRIDERGYFASKYGWDAPHLSFSAHADWSLYEPFNSYFGEFWGKARPLDKFHEKLNGRQG